MAYLWHKDETERSGGAENDENGYNDEGGRLFVGEHEAYGHAEYAHDGHVVHGHAHVLGVVKGRNLN